MTEKTLKPGKPAGPDEKLGWSNTAIAGAAIGSAALTAALLYVTRRWDKGAAIAPHAQDAPETD